MLLRPAAPSKVRPRDRLPGFICSPSRAICGGDRCLENRAFVWSRALGGMAERSKAHAWRACWGAAPRGFESHSLRQLSDHVRLTPVWSRGGRAHRLVDGAVPAQLGAWSSQGHRLDPLRTPAAELTDEQACSCTRRTKATPIERETALVRVLVSVPSVHQLSDLELNVCSAVLFSGTILR